jgi:hypothetical protein
MDRIRHMATQAMDPRDNVATTHADELLRRAIRPPTTPSRLIAAGIKHGSGPLRLITVKAVTR